METRNYYVPRTHYAKMVIDRIVLMVPCCVPAIKPRDYDCFVVSITCNPVHYSLVESILKREGWL